MNFTSFLSDDSINFKIGITPVSLDTKRGVFFLHRKKHDAFCGQVDVIGYAVN